MCVVTTWGTQGKRWNGVEMGRCGDLLKLRIVPELGVSNLPDHPAPQIWHIHLGESEIVFLSLG